MESGSITNQATFAGDGTVWAGKLVLVGVAGLACAAVVTIGWAGGHQFDVESAQFALVNSSGSEGPPPAYGPLTIGMSTGEVVATGFARLDPDSHSLVPTSDDVVDLWDDGSVLTAITVKTAGWSTPQGIAVGSTALDILAAFPGANDVFGDASTFLVRGEAWGYRFSLVDGTIRTICFGSTVGGTPG